MRFRCTLDQLDDGRWTVRHSSRDVGDLQVTAGTKTEALEKMQGEIRYRLELCPCSGESYQHVKIELANDLQE